MKYKEQTQHRGQIIMSVIGCFTVVSGVILALFWPQIFDTILFKVNINYDFYYHFELHTKK